MDRLIEADGHAQERGALGRIIRLFGPDEHDERAVRSPDERTLEAISRFILTYDLGVTPATLACAHDFVLRKNLHLIRKIREREDAGEPVTGIWLEAQTEPECNEGAQKLDRVIEHLEHNVETLSNAASNARDATRRYNHRLAENGRILNETGAQGVDQIVGLVRQMVEHAQILERKLKETEEESLAMRNDLKKARALADQDHLTGLPNRRAFENRLREAIADRGSDDGAKPISVGFCDIDRFKQVNDTHGHDTGDRVLKLVARHLAEATGNDCFVARHGGEEFAVLFDGIPIGEAQMRLDDAREKLSGRLLKDRRTGRQVGPVTFSAGLAQCQVGTEPGDTLKAADGALYTAKQQGRNRVIVLSG